MITAPIAKRIEEMGISRIKVRSPLTCEAPLGICAMCYGMDLSTSRLVEEGMAVGIVYAGWMYGNEQISMAGALSLALGIALQNFPEGAIISMPLRAEGMPKMKTFLCGVLSGIVEPIGAILVILAAGVFVPMLPFLLAFAAGAMFYVVVEELIPDMSSGEHSNIGTICFAVGFALMMALDVGLG